MKAKAHSTEVGKNLSPNREEKNISIALAESRVLLSSCRAMCTLALPRLDKPHAKGKLEKRSRTHRQGKKTPNHLSLQGPSRKGKGLSATPSLPWLGKTQPAPPWKTRGQVPSPRAVEQGSLQPPDPRGSSRAGRQLHPTPQQSKHFLLKSAKLQSSASAYAGGTNQAQTGVQSRGGGTGPLEGTAPAPLAQLSPPSSLLSWHVAHWPKWP